MYVLQVKFNTLPDFTLQWPRLKLVSSLCNYFKTNSAWLKFYIQLVKLQTFKNLHELTSILKVITFCFL